MEQKIRRDRNMGSNLRRLRDQYGISQEKLCAELQRRDCDVEDAIDIYPATVGADYTIRDYRITVSETKVRSEMELIVLGIAEGLTFVD